MQTSLTLTQEVEENCTFVIPGFHKVIRQWWAEVVARDNFAITDHGNNCLKTNRVYLAVDNASGAQQCLTKGLSSHQREHKLIGIRYW